MDEATDKGGAPAPPAAPEANPADERVVVAGSGQTSALDVGGPATSVRAGNPLRAALDVFLPNRAVSRTAMAVLIAFEVAVLLVVWFAKPFPILPTPIEVLQALRMLWMEQGLGPELFASFRFSLEAVGWTTLISLGLSYLTVLPVFRPIVALVSKGRFLSLVGFSVAFVLMTGGGHKLKIWLLVFAMTVFFVTSMAAVIAAIPKEKFDYARTLRMSEWQVVWEVVILGTAAEAFEVLRQNAAIGWMMLTMVEVYVQAEGGVGVMLYKQQRYTHLAEVFAIQLVILLVGLLQDYGIGVLRRLCCPYADIVLERRDA